MVWGQILISRETGKFPVPKSTHYKKGAPLEYVLSALLKLLQKGAPFMTSAKYIGLDVHKEHADSPIMPTLGKSVLATSSLESDSTF